MTKSKERLIKKCICHKKTPGKFHSGSIMGGVGAILVLGIAIGVIYDWLATLILLAILLLVFIWLTIANLLTRHVFTCSIRKAALTTVGSMTEFLVIGI
jgi:hypothetical protein